MDSRSEMREFLVSRRARLTPEEVGLPDFGGRRRVPGLRREEVALVAGISVEYYTRLERGSSTGMSESVIDAVSRALQLDEAEHTHLWNLARASCTASKQRTSSRTQPVTAGLQQLLDAMQDVPAIVQNGRLDVIASNRLGAAFYSELYASGDRPPNFGRFVFLEPRAQVFYRDWQDAAVQTVAILRGAAGRTPHDRSLSNLVGELATRSDTFRTLWASQVVREHRSGDKRVHHPVVGDLDLTFEGMEPATGKGLLLTAYSAKPGTPSHDGLRLLANWAATNDAAAKDAAAVKDAAASSSLDQPTSG
ncbi:helix-turn-helix domain-containing protein [Microlunatus sagamiharensis]|nr:helix-turn-helix transcriptional regulator [Microlunatus sagamiharensis]